jgi:hypothetical protein
MSSERLDLADFMEACPEVKPTAACPIFFNDQRLQTAWAWDSAYVAKGVFQDDCAARVVVQAPQRLLPDLSRPHCYFLVSS